MKQCACPENLQLENRIPLQPEWHHVLGVLRSAVLKPNSELARHFFVGDDRYGRDNGFLVREAVFGGIPPNRSNVW